MKPFDILIKLDRSHIIEEIQFFCPDLEMDYGQAWKKYIGHPVNEVPAFRIVEGEEEIKWENETFSYMALEGQEKRFIFMKREDMTKHLYEQALEMVPYPVSLFDKSTRLVHMNKACRELLKLPSYSQVAGKCLMDIYNVTEEFSTGMTILRTGAPVIDRVDNYSIMTGVNVCTSSCGYPIYKDGQIVGVVTYEKNLGNLKEQIRELEELNKGLSNQSIRLDKGKNSGYTFEDVIGEDPQMTSAVNLAKKIAGKDGHVLLIGETGTGKEIFAQSIHKASARADKKFVAVNCAAFPDTLIEGLIFGTNKGAFTGSIDRPGLLEEANGGTLFLDELNSMSISMQSKLLRVLQEGTFRRIGGQKEYTADIRIISSCNQNPFQIMTKGTLRKDLLFRISTMIIELPPLRDHISDVDILVRRYIEKNSHHFVKHIELPSQEVMDLFRRYDWPGNVRELYHVLDYALNVMEGDTIEISHLPSYLQGQADVPRQPPQITAAPQLSEKEMLDLDLQAIMNRYEEQVLRQLLAYYHNNISRAAKALGVKRQSLQYRLKKLNIVINEKST